MTQSTSMEADNVEHEDGNLPGSSTENLDEKVAVVTGGSRGIGLGVAQALIKCGARVVITGRDEKQLRSAYDSLCSAGDPTQAWWTVAEGRDSSAPERVITETVQRYSRLDILVNNAQEVPALLPLIATQDEELYATLESGLVATWRYMRSAFPHLCRTRGTVINLGSGVGIFGMENCAAYAATKEAIRGLSRVAAREWGRHGITVNVINPLVRTRHADQQSEDDLNNALRGFPLGRFGDAEIEVGGTVAFLSSRSGSYITGATIDVDGGAFLRA